MKRRLSKRKERLANIKQVISRYSDLRTGLISVRVNGNEKLDELGRNLNTARFLVASQDPEIKDKDTPDMESLYAQLGKNHALGVDSGRGLVLSWNPPHEDNQHNVAVLEDRIAELALLERKFDKSLEGIERQMSARKEEAESLKKDVKAGKKGIVVGIKEGVKALLGLVGLSAATGALIGFAKGAVVAGSLVGGAAGVALCLGLVAYVAAVRNKREAKYMNDRLESFSKRISDLYFEVAVKVDKYGKDVSKLTRSLLYSAPEAVRKEAEDRMEPWYKC